MCQLPVSYSENPDAIARYCVGTEEPAIINKKDPTAENDSRTDKERLFGHFPILFADPRHDPREVDLIFPVLPHAFLVPFSRFLKRGERGVHIRLLFFAP